VQWTADASLRTLAVEGVGVSERIGVDGDRRVEQAVVGGDPYEVLLHDLARRRAPRRHGPLHVGDARLEHAERRA
jgi:hypothetical protein